jgi:integrase
MRGHIRKRGRNWCVVVDVGRDQKGVRRQRWLSGFTTRAAAERALTETLARLHGGTDVEPSRQTISRFLSDEWLPAMKARLRDTTYESYRIIVESYLTPTIGGTRLQSLTPAALNAMYADLLAGGGRNGSALSPKSVRNVHIVAHKALADALRWGRVARNVADLADPPAIGRREMQIWSPAQLRQFLASAEGDRLYAAWLLLATSGMRRGEVLGLRWSDVDVAAARLSIVQSLVLVGYEPRFSEPKTAKGRRSISLDPSTVAALRRHRRRQAEERLSWGPTYRDSDLVFTREDGSLTHPESFAGQFMRLAVRAGLPRIRLHDLRHSYATAALTAGIPTRVVSDRLGHATVGITLDTYSHVLPSVDREASERVAELILGNGD